MRSLAQTDGVDIKSQPSVVSRPGQPATIEVGREIVMPVRGTTSEFESWWTGLRTNIHSGQYGFDLQSNIVTQVREATGDTPESFTVKGTTADSAQHHPAGHTVLIESTSPRGPPLYIFVTTERIAPAGRPSDPPKPE